MPFLLLRTMAGNAMLQQKRANPSLEKLVSHLTLNSAQQT